MKKRILAILLCAGMVLGMLPGSLVLSARGESTDAPANTLQLTDGVGYCQACGKNVRWDALTEGAYLGGYTSEMASFLNHYYFAQDNMKTGVIDNFLQLEAGASMCLHLNGMTVNFSSPIVVNGGTLNIMGGGHADFTSANEDAAFITASSWKEKAVNIYGGTYTSSTGNMLFSGDGKQYTVNMVLKLSGNADFDGLVKLNQSQLHLSDYAKVKRIEGSNSTSLRVDVAWENRNATQIVITSNAGESCSLNHFRVSTATVTDSKGNPVQFTVDSDDQISFATVAGETYTVTGLQAKPHVAAPADLTWSNTQLDWKASEDAASYKIYRAVNNQASYELVAENVTETTSTPITPPICKMGIS